MKLFTRYFRINLVATLLIFLLASIAFYFLLWYVMIAQVDEDLKIEQREIESYVAKYERPPEPITVKDQRISFETTDIREKSRSFQTIRSFEPHEHDDFREISFTIPVGDHWLLFRVSKSLEGMRNMNRSIISISLLTVILILLVSLLINRWLIRHLWQPFYDTLSGIKKYRLGEQKKTGFPKSSIDEFNLLNHTLDQFIAGAEKEYTTLREFTENASHELQTPLAVVRSKLDTLIQDEHLSEAQSQAAQSAYEAIQKMARLNQSLLLLSKIENKQFSETEPVDLKKAIEEKMADWQELWQTKGLVMDAALEPRSVIMNPQLADILLNNLFSNATRHTPGGGTVKILLQEKTFTMSNTAAGTSLDMGKLFQRFSKGGQPTDQYGLGLSIIRQIAEVSGIKVDYRFANGLHIFTISF
ncbi:MAG TPA: HAMP domain-containing sensor histidine kinase [Puia sp.]